MSWTENVSDAMSMEKIKIRLEMLVKLKAKSKKQGYEVAKLDPEVMRSNKRYVATTCSHADHTSSCTVLAFLSGRAARS